ncbi:uncharacterized protein DEA37_0002645 [Paragonimus westermani]|uniref:Uncharacterized protein n=1 Tax=Paragonimus westermani TaxID=34504 RepID=A0A5J4N8N8_9TREM|nr:uncharacterized protein DEA37_0002645 [Paragonimus westermani]
MQATPDYTYVEVDLSDDEYQVPNHIPLSHFSSHTDVKHLVGKNNDHPCESPPWINITNGHSSTQPISAQKFLGLLQSTLFSNEEYGQKPNFDCVSSETFYSSSKVNHCLNTKHDYVRENYHGSKPCVELKNSVIKHIHSDSQPTALSTMNMSSLSESSNCSKPPNISTSLISAMQEYTTELVRQSSTFRTASLENMGKLDQNMVVVRTEAARFTRRISSLSHKIEERAQVNKRLRAKIKALLSNLHSINTYLDECGLT